MKIVVIGATGTIGSAVARSLRARHNVVPVSRSGAVRVDISDPASIDALFQEVGAVDAVVACAAHGGMAPLNTESDEQFWGGLDAKLIGQVNLARRAVRHVRDSGSITLTSGRFAEPVPGSSLGFLVNAGLEAFVRSAAVEMPRGLRLNVVSPGWVSESLAAMSLDPGGGTPAVQLADAYVDAVEGQSNGRTLTVDAG
ncbi:short chain dehydrogenase [Streptomyces sp. H27-C3]|uniref:short chain dehydrogenase n=1 Tax=Streptomyces sp. H27-C3 TaxID=3046305 RepID=UPI0024B9D01A|nr:short chain dehydrogenase [Streptomyces sp. H27-C3]MDJ0466562.1 short chain dehydrogenase [Streptomyces sp. H27-C3]